MAATMASAGAGIVPPTNNSPSMSKGNITVSDAGDLNTDARKYAASQGWAMSDGSYPIRPAQNHGAADLDKAIHAVGRSGASGNTIRKHIIGRAHAIGMSADLPDTWSASGMLVSPGQGTASGNSQSGMRSVSTPILDRVQYRFAADLELRAGGDGRTIVGIAVPYGQVQRIDDQLTEVFDGDANRGPFDHQMRAMHRVSYYNLHSVHGGAEVGHIKYARNDAAGLYTESFIAPGDPDGDRTLDEIRSGILPHQSVGFEVGPGGTQMRSGVSARIKANLTELAAVPQGAYGPGAAVADVRAAAVVDGVCQTCGHSDTADRLLKVRTLAAGLRKL